MSKQSKQSIQEKLQRRTPTSMRQIIQPVDMLQTAQEQHDGQTNEVPSEQKNERANVRTNEQRNEYSTERKGGRTIERSEERKRVRHSFDIYKDQLLSLKAIAIDREQAQGKRVLLGDLVQEALDKFIADERTND